MACSAAPKPNVCSCTCFPPFAGRRQHRRRLVGLPLLDVLRHGVAEARLVAVHRVQVAVIPAQRISGLIYRMNQKT